MAIQQQLHCNSDTCVEVVEGTVDSSRPVVVKLHKCSNFNRNVQEALLLMKVASAYTCKLLDSPCT